MLHHDIDEWNFVNGYPVKYVKNEEDASIADDTFGEILLLECTNYTVDNVTMAGLGCDYIVGAIGIVLAYCTDVVFDECDIPAFGTGLAIFASTYVITQGCTFNGGDAQIYLGYSSYCTIDSNTLLSSSASSENNTGAIFLEASSINNITGNVIDSSMRIGISIKTGSDSNNVIGNEILDGDEAGIFAGGNYNTIMNNTIAGNLKYGVQLSIDSNYNSVLLNDFLGNAWNDTLYSAQAIDDGSNNLWNDTYGNYWDDYHEHYPDAIKVDWIWDTPYEIDGSAATSDDEPLGRPRDYFT
jgi:parallel beta-helix repeat protein